MFLRVSEQVVETRVASDWLALTRPVKLLDGAIHRRGADLDTGRSFPQLTALCKLGPRMRLQLEMQDGFINRSDPARSTGTDPNPKRAVLSQSPLDRATGDAQCDGHLSLGQPAMTNVAWVLTWWLATFLERGGKRTPITRFRVIGDCSVHMRNRSSRLLSRSTRHRTRRGASLRLPVRGLSK